MTNTSSMRLLLQAKNNATVPSTLEDALEDSGYNRLIISDSGSNHKSIKKRFTVAGVSGRSAKKVLMENGFASAFGSNPTEDSYINLLFQSADGSGTYNMYATCLLEYEVKCYERIPVASS